MQWCWESLKLEATAHKSTRYTPEVWYWSSRVPSATIMVWGYKEMTKKQEETRTHHVLSGQNYETLNCIAHVCYSHFGKSVSVPWSCLVTSQIIRPWQPRVKMWKPGVVVYTCIPVVTTTWEAEAGGWLEFRSSGLYCAMPPNVLTKLYINMVTSYTDRSRGQSSCLRGVNPPRLEMQQVKTPVSSSRIVLVNSHGETVMV
jgi:hypothetical protein